MSAATMVQGEQRVALTIPAAYVDDFRDAVVFEIADSTQAVESNRNAIREAAEFSGGDDRAAMHDADWRSSVRLLAEDGVLLDQLEAAEPGEDFTATAGEAVLAHACGSMARKVAAPRIKRLLRYSPLDEQVAADLHEQMARLSWAIDNSARFS